MSKECAICGKKPLTGNRVSHSHKTSKRRWIPNLQKIRVEIDGKTRKTLVCTKCIRSGKAKKVL